MATSVWVFCLLVILIKRLSMLLVLIKNATYFKIKAQFLGLNLIFRLLIAIACIILTILLPKIVQKTKQTETKYIYL